MLAASPALAEALQKVTTIAQACLLVPKAPPAGAAAEAGCRGPGPAGPLCVINTHLFFHPYAPHIRTMHTAAILEEVAAFLDACMQSPTVAARLGGHRPAVVFGGDLNSDLNEGRLPGTIELLQSGRLPASHWDWLRGASFSWGAVSSQAYPLSLPQA